MPDLLTVPLSMIRPALASLLWLLVVSAAGEAADTRPKPKTPVKTTASSWDAHVWEHGSVESFWRARRTAATTAEPDGGQSNTTPTAPTASAPSDFSNRQSGK
ncbi:MAG: hypothetical protein QE273_08210 [Verrucomicrobiales bacterium]|nr:hypothetical protein [Verrucomicrobiales bacterium]